MKRRFLFFLCLLTAFSLLLVSGCIPLTRHEEEETEETTVSETVETSETTETTETTIEVTETTAEQTSATTADPNSTVVGGITITYDFTDDTYQDDDGQELASCHFQNVTVDIAGFPDAAVLINETLNMIRKGNADLYDSSCETAQTVYDDYGMPGLIGPYEVSATVNPSYISDKLISFVVYVYSYSGGAHGGTTYAGYTFDSRTGDYLTFGDLCSNDTLFETFVQNEIVGQINAMPAAESDAFFDYVTGVPSAFGSAAWCFSDADGPELMVIYQEYEIAPYAYGSPTFMLPLADCLSYFNAYGQGLFTP
jgi:hypothetical protein